MVHLVDAMTYVVVNNPEKGFLCVQYPESQIHSADLESVLVQWMRVNRGLESSRTEAMSGSLSECIRATLRCVG